MTEDWLYSKKKSNIAEIMKRILQSKGDTFHQLHLKQSMKGSVQWVLISDLPQKLF